MTGRLEQICLPPAIRYAVDKLLLGLATTRTRSQIEVEKATQRGFIQGLETAACLLKSDIEVLNLVFDDAVHERLKCLGDSP